MRKEVFGVFESVLCEQKMLHRVTRIARAVVAKSDNTTQNKKGECGKKDAFEFGFEHGLSVLVTINWRLIDGKRRDTRRQNIHKS